jgi:DNA mismatch endonuclease (patch repair protein)
MAAPYKTSAERSANMARIRSKDTKPEMLVRKALHKLGFRYRLHVRDLPGRPDIVLPKYRTIIEVKGCFWHGHTCIDGRVPKSNSDYWVPKLARNQARDRANMRRLRSLGWSVHCVWECHACRPNQRLLDGRLTRIMSNAGTRKKRKC